MAFGLSDLRALLETWKDWKDLKAAAAKVTDLEKRVAALESRLERAPGRRCDACGALSMRVVKTEEDPVFGVLGANRRTWRCQDCGYEEGETKA